MTNKSSQYFLQSVAIGNVEIPRNMITTASYIEQLNLKAPILRLEVRDTSNYVVSELGLKEGAKLVVKMGGGADNSSAIWADTMVVVCLPYQNDVLSILAVCESLYSLCQPASRPLFFVDKQPADILKALVAGSAQLFTDPFPKLTTYHLSMSQKPTSLIAAMASDHGSRAWIARGSLNMRTLTSFEKKKPRRTFEMNNPQAHDTFSKVNLINQDDAFLAPVRYRFVGYSETEGFISVGSPALPVKNVSVSDKSTLRNLSYTLVPKLDAECEGDPSLTVGDVISVLVHRYDSDSGLDESVPKNMVIMSATHYEDRRSYVCRLILGVVKSA